MSVCRTPQPSIFICEGDGIRMRSPDGGFYSALDADSPLSMDPQRNVEGAYYL
jgi:hypothetical protein